MSKIEKIRALEVLDSRGNPTVQAMVVLDCGSVGSAIVPSGASTGENEAIELRDGGERYLGKGVQNAVTAVNTEIAAELFGRDASDQRGADEKMIALDGTKNKGRLGANAILAVSLALAKAAAASYRMPLYRYLGGSNVSVMPAPGMNIINGGVHADNLMDFQEFMVMPIRADSMAHSVRIGAEVFHTLKRELMAAGHQTNVGDEGGFAPNVSNARDAMDFIMRSIEKAGYKPGIDVAFVLDPAPSEFWKDGVYHYQGEGLVRNVDEHVANLGELVRDYPIISIEDPCAEFDRYGWQKVTKELGQKIQLTGDDNFCTNIELLNDGIANDMANSILVKINQIGTLTESLDVVDRAHRAGYSVVISHRSGETEDNTVADLAVATGCGQIKTGSLSRSDRTSKYNRLLCIEEELGPNARYGHDHFLSTFKWQS